MSSNLPAPPESTVTLLERVQRGDAAALDTLLARYLPRLTRWASGRLPHSARDLADTEDLVQETIISALAHLQRFEIRGDGALHAYLRQAVWNRIRGEFRRLKRRPPGLELDEHLVDGRERSPLEQAIGREALDRYEAALAQLSPGDRDAIIARIELGHSYAEVAAALGRPTAEAARMAVTRALSRLAALMRT